LVKRLRQEILAAYLADNTKARLLQSDGEYVRASPAGKLISAQEYLMRVAEGATELPPA
jgi:polyphosphate kinase